MASLTLSRKNEKNMNTVTGKINHRLSSDQLIPFIFLAAFLSTWRAYARRTVSRTKRVHTNLFFFHFLLLCAGCRNDHFPLLDASATQKERKTVPTTPDHFEFLKNIPGHYHPETILSICINIYRSPRNLTDHRLSARVVNSLHSRLSHHF